MKLSFHKRHHGLGESALNIILILLIAVGAIFEVSADEAGVLIASSITLTALVLGVVDDARYVSVA